jgi:hypothetical protein
VVTSVAAPPAERAILSPREARNELTNLKTIIERDVGN